MSQVDLKTTKVTVSPDINRIYTFRINDLVLPATWQPDNSTIDHLKESILKHGVLQPITVSWDAETKKYTVIDGVHRFHVSKLLGLHTIPTKVSNGMYKAPVVEYVDINLFDYTPWIIDHEKLKLIKTQIKLGKNVGPISVYFNKSINGMVIIDGHYRYFAWKELGYKVIACIIKDQPESIDDKSSIDDKIANGKSLTPAEFKIKFGKTIEVVEPMPSITTEPKNYFNQAYNKSLPVNLTDKGIESTPKYPFKTVNLKDIKEFVKDIKFKPCLEPGCKVKIRIRPERNFCRKHSPNRTFDNFPSMDRDGDPIWVGKGYVVTKIKDMEDQHLTNTLVFLETNAKKRCELTGLDPTFWLKKAGFRYPMLLAEAKRRDAKLVCSCDKGLRVIEIIDSSSGFIKHEATICGDCIQGQNRRNAAKLALQIKSKKINKLSILTVIAVGLLIGGPAGYILYDLLMAYFI